MGEGNGTNFVNGMIVLLVGVVAVGVGLASTLWLIMLVGVGVFLTGAVLSLISIGTYMNERGRT